MKHGLRTSFAGDAGAVAGTLGHKLNKLHRRLKSAAPGVGAAHFSARGKSISLRPSAWAAGAPKACAFLLIALASAALLAAACGDDGADAGSDTTRIEDGPPAAASLQTANGGAGQGITVSGQGAVTADPDTALLSLGVSVLADTARDARDRAARAMNDLLDSLKGNGIDEKDINTTQFSLNPEYDHTGGGQPRLKGYRVTNMVAIKVRDLDRTPEVMDEAVDAVGDPIQISGVSFTVDDPQSLLSQARAEAMADARAKAGELAQLGEVELGKPIAISETSGGLPPEFLGFARDLEEATTTPIEPGQLDITVSVQVTYAIK